MEQQTTKKNSAESNSDKIPWKKIALILGTIVSVLLIVEYLRKESFKTGQITEQLNSLVKAIGDQGKLLWDRIDSMEAKFDNRMDQMLAEMMEMKGDNRETSRVASYQCSD